MNRKFLPGMIVGVLLLVAAGAFYGGMRFQRTRSTNTRANFFANRGGTGTADFGAGGGGGGGGIGGRRGNNTGRIESIEGNVITVGTQQEQLMVKVTDATKHLKLVEGTLGDLQVGVNIIVGGERDANGIVSAANIQLAGPVPALVP